MNSSKQFIKIYSISRVIVKDLARPLALSLASAIFLLGTLNAQDLEKNITDGPYLFIEGDGYKARWIKDGQVQEETFTREESKRFDPGLRAFESSYLNREIIRDSVTDYQGVNRLAALSDIHGQIDVLIPLLQNHGIIDKDENWAYGDSHFVITGDVTDRGPYVTEVLWFLYKLEQQAEAAGGRVHLLLGNHEVMVMNADLRYIHERYNQTTELLGLTYDELYGPQTVLGQWLRSKPVTISINNILFAHGGLSREVATGQFGLAKLNRVFWNRILDKTRQEQKADAEANLLRGSAGPTWHRGYFRDSTVSIATMDSILSYFGKEHIVVGHTSQKEVQSRFGGRLFAVDSSMKYGKSGEILIVEDGEFWRGLYDGTRLKF